MIDSPDLEQFVFCRVLDDVEIDVSVERNILYEQSIANDERTEEDDDEFGEIQEHRAGSYLIVMYKTVRELVRDGKVELLM